MWQIETAHITQLDPLQLGPEPLARVQLRGIGREPFQVDSRGCSGGQELLDGLTAMDRGPIPDQHRAARHLAQQMFEKGNDINGIDRPVLTVEIQLTRRGDGTDY